ncbi:MAG TPA: sigma-70 family RNA polymerase sigma factor [Pirellulales bacterium]|nr:sigma-70 family RNA polymerase sigma factor [Pirellulales bacterium]
MSGILPQSASEATSLSLLDLVKARDDEAWKRFSAIYGPMVYHWARQRNLQDQDVSDITQEVFAVVFERIGAFRRDRQGDSLRGWLWTITRNKINDHFRAAAPRPRAVGGSSIRQRLEQEPDPFPDDSSEIPANAEGAAVRAAMELVRGEVEDKTWQRFLRVVIDRRPVDEVAAAAGMTISAVYKSKSRVLKRLKHYLDDGVFFD